MNITKEQLDLLRILVGVYNGGCRAEFLLTLGFDGDALVYKDKEQPDIEIDAALSDFKRLASEDLLDVRYTENGTLCGKPTAKGVKLVASGGMKNAATDTAKWTVDQQVQIALNYLRTKRALCPLDGSSLKVADTTADGGPPFSIDAYCPLCRNEMASDPIYNRILEEGSTAHTEVVEHQSKTAPVKPDDKRLTLQKEGSWSDRKKWIMGIVAAMIIAAVIGFISVISNHIGKATANHERQEQSISIRVSNKTALTAKINPYCQFYVTEETTAGMQEYPPGRLYFEPVEAAGYNIPTGVTRSYLAKVPSPFLDSELFERGSATLYLMLRHDTSSKPLIETIPFHERALRENYIQFDIVTEEQPSGHEPNLSHDN